MDATYHEGERAVQRRAGDTARADLATGMIKREIPDVAKEFLAAQRLLVVASTDPGGLTWASLLTGPPGFARALDARTVVVDRLPPPGDPLAAALEAPAAPLGLLALEPQTRRRMRLNGSGTVREGSLLLRTEQVYSNCRKYIRERAPLDDAAQPAAAGASVEQDVRLSEGDRSLIGAADTFFVASSHPGGATDASHRGGEAGFVQVIDDRRLAWPDYEGNAMYMTLGNIELNPRAGLLFVDWEGGRTLQLAGVAAVDWAPARTAAVPGAKRIVDFAVERVVRMEGARLLRWKAGRGSRFNPALGLQA
jgi:predicted pyridoxine 5'-phosphate oxidase superfamily flavin-nucleotide-binding protein